MTSSSQQKVPANRAHASRPLSYGRITVYALCQRHIQLLAGLPGEVSQFYQSEVGYEWRCELELGGGSPASRGHDAADTLQLHFSLVDLEGRLRPTAVLYLVVQRHAQAHPERLLLPLEDPADTHEQLNAQLAQTGASVAVFENASRFIEALAQVKETLAQEVSWS